ncbi:pupal cuticle protein 20 [Lucilia sericata]|uniref:pupal cuticle protein 20 n=1 Tax=Lucilia sericata TaxID=13632 RepID=UPI0018A7ECA3|nr:pupal cuticle protein 20 [Lucilia sericata]
MKFFVCVATVALCLGAAAAGRPSTKYLPPNFAAVGAAGSSQYPHYHAVSGGRVAPSAGHQYAAAASAPVHAASSQYAHNRAAAQIPILRNDYSNDGSGNYNFGFETGNGIKRDESGHFQGSWPGGSLNVAGSYSYTGDDGKLYSVNYKADSNGFHAEGDHLPTPPPIPREIQETLHLHQHAGSQPGSAGSYSAPSSYSGGGHRAPAANYAAASHHSAANVRAPNANYLPPQQGQGYNYGRRH